MVIQVTTCRTTNGFKSPVSYKKNSNELGTGMCIRSIEIEIDFWRAAARNQPLVLSTETTLELRGTEVESKKPLLLVGRGAAG